KLVQAAAIKPLQREINLKVNNYHFEWEYAVIDDPQINAFCLPAGKICVFGGLLRFVENDDQLAAVLSHEIAHALAHHASERLARQQLLGQASRVGGTGPADPEARHQIVNILAGLSGLSHDRQQESEADHIGVFLMTFAGYDPRAAVTFWERMSGAAAGRAQPPELLSDHPSDARRVEQIRAWVPNAVAAKKAYEEGRVAIRELARSARAFLTGSIPQT